MKKTAELSTGILDFYFNTLKMEKTINNELKEMIKNYYFDAKQKKLEKDGDFDRIVVDEVVLHEKLSTNYIWKENFYEELIDCGVAHLVLKHGNNLNKRFDLSAYELPKNPENQSLHFSTANVKNDYHQVILEQDIEVEKCLKEWRNLPIEQVIDLYMRSKKKLDIHERKYDIEKKQLLDTMKKENVHSLNGFSIKDESTNYDYSKLYNAVLEEKVMIATNGEKSVDLLNDKPIEVTEKDLFNCEIIKKSIRKQERLDTFFEHLGEKYYYVQGYREETDIIKRFPISTSKVEEVIAEGLLSQNVLEVERTYESNDDLRLNFEITTLDTINDRKFMWYEKMKERNAIASAKTQYEDN